MRDRRVILVLGILAPFLLCSCTHCKRPSTATDDTTVVADHKYWGGDEGNAARRLFAKFDDGTKMGDVLNLNQPIMDFSGLRWVLGDIVICIDLNGNGHAALWDVSGPKPVIETYLAWMNDLSQNSASGIYDYGTEIIKCLPTAAFEPTEE